MQFELLEFLKNEKTEWTARALAQHFGVNSRNVRSALYKLWKHKLVERESNGNESRRFEYKYWVN